MFATFFSVALFAVSALTGVIAAEPTIKAPTSITQCKGVNLSWSGVTGKVNIVAVDAAEPCGPELSDLGDYSGSSTNWMPKLAAGQKIMLSLIDEHDNEAWTDPITVLAGDTSCLPASLRPSPSPTPSPAPTSSDAPQAVGAVGSDPKLGNGASASQISLSLMAVSALFSALLLL